MSCSGVPSTRARRPRPAADLVRALEELTAFDPRKGRIAERRFFGGLSLDETARLLGLSVATVERDWQAARVWLYTRLTRKPDNGA